MTEMKKGFNIMGIVINLSCRKENCGKPLGLPENLQLYDIRGGYLASIKPA